MKTTINITKVVIIYILLAVGLMSVLGDLREGTPYWWAAFIIIKISGVIMILVGVYLTAHWKTFNPIRVINEDKNPIDIITNRYYKCNTTKRMSRSTEIAFTKGNIYNDISNSNDNQHLTFIDDRGVRHNISGDWLKYFDKI